MRNSFVRHRKRITAKFLLWNRQVTDWSASDCCGSGDHPSSDHFVRLDTQSKFIAMGGRLEFYVVRSFSPKLVSLRASQPPLRTGRKWLKIRTVSGPKYTDQMGYLGIRAEAEKSCPVSPAGRHFTKRSMVLGGQPTPSFFFFTAEFAKSNILPCRSSTIMRLCETRPVS